MAVPKRFSESKKTPAEGDIFWIDVDQSIRIATKCESCGKLVLSPWISVPLPHVKCGNCLAKAK